ncbi:MAG: hypothetical protein K8U03_25295 [Planctomycetia bacterium]|nr:hypothetical protein [Planctomycetia bacterium]
MSLPVSEFPNLKPNEFEPTSPENEFYNCIAWAAGVHNEWWEPSVDGVWPSGVPLDPTIENLSLVFAGLGYESCESADLESGFEKIAFYGTHNEYEHAARQLDDGRWTSKMGAGIDIRHVNLDCIGGGLYGAVVSIMRRPKR